MEDNIITLQFNDTKLPDFKEVIGNDFVWFGDDNLYPNYLCKLLDKSPKHNSIINSKTTYIFGGGLKSDVESPLADIFIKENSTLAKQIVLDIEAFGMCYVQCIPTRGKNGYKFFHVSYQKVRANKDASIFYFKEDWNKRWEAKKTIPAFDPKLECASIFMFKEYRPGRNLYGLPGFISSCNYIEADIEVSKAVLTNAQSGFNASKFINFFNGSPTPTDQKSIESKFKGKFGGSEGEKVVISFNAPGATPPTVQDLGVSDLTKEDFAQVDQLIATNIYAGHRITNPALFGIPPDTRTLGGNAGAELKMSYDIFKATYVAEKVDQAKKIINFFAMLNGITTGISFISVEPVGFTFTETTLLQAAPRSWLLEQLGIDKDKYTDAPVVVVKPGTAPAGNPATPVAHEAVNDNLKNLTPKQHAQLVRVIRQYKKGQITLDVAKILLKNSLGLSDADISKMLDAKFSSSVLKMSLVFLSDHEEQDEAFDTDEDVAMLFEAHGEPTENYNVFEKRLATFDREYNDIEDKIKVLVEKNPKATPESIAKTLNIDVAIVKDYLKGGSGGGIGTIKKIPKFEVRYSYEKRPDVEGAAVIPTTRPFCRKMLSMNKFYTRKDIQSISAFLGYDVMQRAGGFWNNNGTIEAHCRHEFFSQIVIKK